MADEIFPKIFFHYSFMFSSNYVVSWLFSKHHGGGGRGGNKRWGREGAYEGRERIGEDAQNKAILLITL